MAEELRLAFILLGSLAIGAVILHGIWTVRKTVNEERKLKQVEEVEPEQEEDELEQIDKQFKLKQMEMDFAQIEAEKDRTERSGLPVANVDVDSIYQEKTDNSEQSSASSSDKVTTDSQNIVPKNELFPEQESQKSQKSGQPAQNDVFDGQVETVFDAQPERESEREPEIGNFSALDDDMDKDVGNLDIGISSSTDPQEEIESVEMSSQQTSNEDSSPKKTTSEPQQVLMLFVDKSEGTPIEGAKLLPVLLTLGFKFGEMDFFHRHEHNSGQGEVLFSLANMYNPGTFDVDNMEQMSTRGLTIFMTLPNAGEPLQTFNMMHNAAKKIADEFGAKVLDEKRRPLDVAIVRNYVEKIRKF